MSPVPQTAALCGSAGSRGGTEESSFTPSHSEPQDLLPQTGAGVKQVDACGVSDSGVTVYCAAVTRLPSRKESTGAMTLGHFILYDVTSPDSPYTTSDAFSFPKTDPGLFQHEFGGHVAQWEENGSGFLWTILTDSVPWECDANERSGVDGNGCK